MSAAHDYTVVAHTKSRAIAWTARDNKEARRWFLQMMRSKVTIDTGVPIVSALMMRDGEVRDQWSPRGESEGYSDEEVKAILARGIGS